MSDKPLTEVELHKLLKENYGCKCDGKDLPAPYQSTESLPTYFISPSGLHFPVQPPIGTHYPPFLVKEIIKAGKLDVVVSLKVSKDKTPN